MLPTETGRQRSLTDECASLVGIARGWGADYFPNFGAGGGELRRARDLVPQVELAVGAEVTAADSLDGKDVVDFGELTDLVDLRSLRGRCSASYQSKLLAAQDYWLVCAKGCTDGRLRRWPRRPLEPVGQYRAQRGGP